MSKRKPKPKYQVLTWDWEIHDWSPQQGVRRGPYSLFGLRKALRKLRDMGYDTTRNGGVSVLVERIEDRRQTRLC